MGEMLVMLICMTAVRGKGRMGSSVRRKVRSERSGREGSAAGVMHAVKRIWGAWINGSCRSKHRAPKAHKSNDGDESGLYEYEGTRTKEL